GPDYSSFQISPGSHMDQVATHWYRKGPIPVTINIGIPPTCTMMAGSGFTYVILPRGCDELGVAGALQGYPVELVRARTKDAWSIANAEYVVEGYIDTTQKVWESPLAEKDDAQGVHPFHPEWSGYMGKSYRTYKFQATAITHRADRPLYYGLIVHGMDEHFIDGVVREACFLELAERIVPGLCVDTHIPMGMTDWGGVIFQVKTRRARSSTRTRSSGPATTSRSWISPSSIRPSRSRRRRPDNATTPSFWRSAGSDDRSGRAAREEKGQLVVAAREVIGGEHHQHEADRDRRRRQPARPSRVRD